MRSMQVDKEGMCTRYAPACLCLGMLMCILALCTTPPVGSQRGWQGWQDCRTARLCCCEQPLACMSNMLWELPAV
jgi:hypothetical protein